MARPILDQAANAALKKSQPDVSPQRGSTSKLKAVPPKLVSVQPEQPMRAFTTAAALALLFEKATPALTGQQMQWLADGAVRQVGSDAHALAGVLEGTACLMGSDEESGSFQDADSTATLLFNLHNQLNTIAGLADIAENAGYLARRALKGGAA